MMSLKEYAVDVDKTLEDIIKLCEKLEIKAKKEDDMLTEEDIIRVMKSNDVNLQR